MAIFKEEKLILDSSVSTGEAISKIVNNLYKLHENLAYVLSNIDDENLAPGFTLGGTGGTTINVDQKPIESMDLTTDDNGYVTEINISYYFGVKAKVSITYTDGLVTSIGDTVITWNGGVSET